MTGKILIVDDDILVNKMISIALKKLGYEITAVEDSEEALKILATQSFDLALLDIVMPKIDGIQLLKMIKETNSELVVIMMTGFPNIETSIDAIKNDAFDYLTKPFSIEEIRLTINKVFDFIKMKKENLKLKQALNSKDVVVELIGDSPKIQKIKKTIESIQDTDCTVLIDGESGTGKEVLARTIHNSSNRSKKPFVAINCGAMPETLLESELFGHEKGSFTGAISTKKGLFEAGNGGVVFLDEIAETSPALQIKLLRVLEDKAVRKIGSTKNIKLDFRLFAASNKKLADEVKKGKFREDLFYRLNVISITMPPLRERKQDIPLFLERFVQIFSLKHNKDTNGFSKDALDYLMMYDYPGNVRELANLVERAIILSKNKTIQKNIMPAIMSNHSNDLSESAFDLDIAEKNHIKNVLEITNSKKSKAAELLGIDRKTLYLKIKKYEISP
jgi:DNA-binding NtrC family response regulator